MKTATYHTADGPLTIEYDPNHPCEVCGLPVEHASMGGTTLCPCCDMGIYRDGTRWESVRKDVIRRTAQRKAEEMKQNVSDWRKNTYADTTGTYTDTSSTYRMP